MKKLFADPHFNVMDGLDTYIDDYGKPDPIPASMLRQMNQSKFLGLFDDEDERQTKAPPRRRGFSRWRGHCRGGTVGSTRDPCPRTPADEDPDLQLQQDDAAGRPGAGRGPGA